ncbi:TerB family tellurite resistance protein [Vibrio alginolyticus]|uniref:TerB family tellurite resistance protein n=1 Tax=Vibrio alginolyticus TaxID=663 RepID=UPI0021D1C778|nr:TerB family tellurite resistance protein [uncultured Vibrio sp.]EIC9816632.1 TerB family tellurite resistance protein [Vibrio alginolyticus]EII5414832.1 TerB family tellurite resistance protein [Vibrio alginolyticus]EMA2435536.1 TerB family tellurite resistance protein [Vibrio parahaemolyticus]HCE4997268.1 TerB family tellurite resistance protein [Vibrio parahaemolyticus]
MSFWKVLGGACAGVAAVVALPVAGPVGAVTAVGAAVAAGVGAAAGGVAEYFDDSENEAEARGERRGESAATAKYEQRVTKLEDRLKDAFAKLSENADFYNALIAMESVAMACASCDGNIDENERAQIEMFIHGASSVSLPEHVKVKLEDIYHNPPTPNEAFKLAKESGLDTEVFNEIIEVVMHADGVQHENEEAFLDAWNIAKVA